jgi:prepilin-type N-terminal cleavage/methylation domain-containing protein/prepilin-type processing-associated H-X9-DG protein
MLRGAPAGSVELLRRSSRNDSPLPLGEGQGVRAVWVRKNQSYSRTTIRNGFTLVELLVVITIIGILIALLLPAIQSAREAARQMQCQNNLKQMALAEQTFAETHGWLPVYFTGAGSYTWAAQILPFMELQSLADAAHVQDNWSVYKLNAASPSVIKQQVGAYYCPTRRAPPQISWKESGSYNAFGALGDYAMCFGDGTAVNSSGAEAWYIAPNGVVNFAIDVKTNPISIPSNKQFTLTFSRGSRTFADITDGLSNTIVLGEKHVPDRVDSSGKPFMGNADHGDGTWYNDDTCTVQGRLAGPGHLTPGSTTLTRPYYIAPSPTAPIIADDFFNGNFGSWHTGGVCHFAFVDGSVQKISPSIDIWVLGYLANIADGHPIPAGAY